MRGNIVVLILFFVVGCKSPRTNTDQLIVEETELAEVKNPEPLSQEDSMQFVSAFSSFIDAIQNQDGFKIAHLSVQGVYWPSSLNHLIRVPFGLPDFLVSVPWKSWYRISIPAMLESRKQKMQHSSADYSLSFEVPKRVRDRIEYEIFDFIFTKSSNTFLFKELRNYTHAYRDITPSIDSIIAYFPRADSSGIRYRQPGRMSNYENIWYSQILASLQEPVLKDYKGHKEIYRLTWIPAFHFPVVVRIEDSATKYSIAAKILEQQNDEFPDEILVNNHQHINFFAWNKFKNKMEGADFWNMLLEDPAEQGNDGSEWVLEGIKDGEYHVVTRWSPEFGGFRDACRLLINITTLPIKQKDIY